MSAQKLVQNSLEHGYLVGSRGSVGSSIVAYHVRHHGGQFAIRRTTAARSASITTFEVPADCGLRRGSAGRGVPEVRREAATRTGFNIPFETFLGFGGDKVPDIDLNFSGEYQAKAHALLCADVRQRPCVPRRHHRHRRGKNGLRLRQKVPGGAGQDRPKGGGEPAGGSAVSASSARPASTPAASSSFRRRMRSGTSARCSTRRTTRTPTWITTHFEYHSMEENLLKLDMLGHDDPTMIRMLEDMTGVDAQKIPLGRPGHHVASSRPAKVLGYEDDPILGPVGCVGHPGIRHGLYPRNAARRRSRQNSTRSSACPASPTARTCGWATRSDLILSEHRVRQRRHRLPRRHHAVPHQVRDARKAVVQDHGGRPKGQRSARRRGGGNDGRGRAGMVHRLLQEDQVSVSRRPTRRRMS